MLRIRGVYRQNLLKTLLAGLMYGMCISYIALCLCAMLPPTFSSLATQLFPCPFLQSWNHFSAISSGPSSRSFPSSLSFHSFIPCSTPAENPKRKERTNQTVVWTMPGMVLELT